MTWQNLPVVDLTIATHLPQSAESTDPQTEGCPGPQAQCAFTLQSPHKRRGQEKRFSSNGKVMFRAKNNRQQATEFPKSDFHDCNTLTFSNKGSDLNTYTHTWIQRSRHFAEPHLSVDSRTFLNLSHVYRPVSNHTEEKDDSGTPGAVLQFSSSTKILRKAPEQTERTRKSPRERMKAGSGT